MTKKCTKCLKTKPIAQFCKNKICKNGYEGRCIECAKAYKARHFQQNKSRYKALNKTWINKNKKRHLEHKRAYLNAHRDENKEYQQRYRDANRAACNKRIKEWQKQNPDRLKAANARRVKRIQLATPKWLTHEQHEQMAYLYDLSGNGVHVDHIIPICGESVSGLHVPWNLRLVLAEENAKKGRKLLKELIQC